MTKYNKKRNTMKIADPPTKKFGSTTISRIMEKQKKLHLLTHLLNGSDITFKDIGVSSAQNTFLIAKESEHRFDLEEGIPVTVEDKVPGKDDATAPVSNLTTMKRARIKFTIKIGEKIDGIDHSNATFQTRKEREETDQMSAFRDVMESTAITTAYISTAHTNAMLVGGTKPLDDNVSRMTKGTLEPDTDSQGETVTSGSTTTSKVVAGTNKQKIEFLKCQAVTTEKL